MNRSEINKAILMVEKVLKENHFYLPPFAHMSPEDWKNAGLESARIVENRLGWDITDYGADDYHNLGGVLFTIRNGNFTHPESGTPYAEKIIVLEPGQRLPLHFHWGKTEDIINRGGGILSIELYNAKADESVDTESDVRFFCDGVERTVKAGEIFDIMPGASITLTPFLYHRFWANKDGGVLICGEVSSVNDDFNDNNFAEPVKRFSAIVEDEAPIHLLCNEYPAVN